MIQKSPFFMQGSLKASVYYAKEERSLIKALEYVYAQNEVPLGNSGLALQRALKNGVVWNDWFYGCPQVQGKVAGKNMLFFDDRVVDVNHLDDHPLLNPSFLSDHWSEIQVGAMPVSREYLSTLVDLSRDVHSGVRALSHKDLGRINASFTLSEAKDHAYLKAFLGLSEEERKAYMKEHQARYGDSIHLWCGLSDA